MVFAIFAQVKNRTSMDVLRKELTGIYESQNLDAEKLDYQVWADCKREADTAVAVDGGCRVVTDAAADTCHISAASLAYLAGLSDDGYYCRDMNSSDEDVIYARIHPEDLVDKRMLEYEFFKFVDTLPREEKLHYKATCRFRLRDRRGQYIYIDNSTKIMRLSPAGKMLLILCSYALSPVQKGEHGISPRIMSELTGEVRGIALEEKRLHILTPREKEILSLIRNGYASKQIAAALGISIHTVNRHRQNILEKLSVGNSVEAVTAAAAMNIL